jgi:hypothetical protein
MPRSENTVCAIVSPRKDLVRGTNPPTEQSTHTTTDNNMHVVYMARNDLLRTDHYAPSAEDARRLGDVGCGSQGQDASSISHENIELTRMFGNRVLLEYWSLKEPVANPPNRNTIPKKLTYVTHYALDMAYVTPPGNTETYKKFKRRLYKGLLNWRTPNEIKNCESPTNTRQSPGHAYGPHYTQHGYLSS